MGSNDVRSGPDLYPRAVWTHQTGTKPIARLTGARMEAPRPVGGEARFGPSREKL
jgi:hypothetical protein